MVWTMSLWHWVWSLWPPWRLVLWSHHGVLVPLCLSLMGARFEIIQSDKIMLPLALVVCPIYYNFGWVLGIVKLKGEHYVTHLITWPKLGIRSNTKVFAGKICKIRSVRKELTMCSRCWLLVGGLNNEWTGQIPGGTIAQSSSTGTTSTEKTFHDLGVVWLDEVEGPQHLAA